MKSINC